MVTGGGDGGVPQKVGLRAAGFGGCSSGKRKGLLHVVGETEHGGAVWGRIGCRGEEGKGSLGRLNPGWVLAMGVFGGVVQGSMGCRAPRAWGR